MAPNGASTGRFQLPALTPISFSLTEGTDIPPPLDSPVKETLEIPAPKPQVANTPKPIKTDVSESANSIAAEPLSPTSPTKPGSVRRFLSRRSMHSSYMIGSVNGGSKEELASPIRPESPAASFAIGRPELAKKKSGGWFRRLGNSENSAKRSSVIYNVAVEQKQPAPKKGPPPPKLPELNQLESKVTENDHGSFGGDDIFKNIR